MQANSGWMLALAFSAFTLAAQGVGQPAPDLRLTARDGRPFALADLKGKVVLVDFWASWCGPCRKSFPALDSLAAEGQARGLEVVGISLDETPEAVTRFLAETPVRFTIALDPSGGAAQAFQVEAMPTSFLLDRDGRVVARFEGGSHLEEERAAALALLEGVAPAASGVRVAAGFRATGSLKAWNRGHLADPIMALDGDPIVAAQMGHVYQSKEGSAGDGGAAGGGCGCR